MAKERIENLSGILGLIERAGNRLPHPVTIFVLLTFIVMLLSWLFQGVSMVDPKGRTLVVQSLVSADGLIWLLKNCVKNFVDFKPLGLVLVMMMGLGVAEEVGLLSAVLRGTILSAPRGMVTAIIAFCGVMGNMASSAAFVVVPPLGAMIFKGLGRNPLAGMAAGFAGCAAGLNANLLVVGTDVGLAAITQQAAQILDPAITVHPAVNWYFMSASTFLLTGLIVFITDKFLEPRLAGMDMHEGAMEAEDMSLTPLERRGLRWALIGCVVYLLLILATVVPEHGILRDPKNFTIVPSPFLDSLVPILFGFFLAPGASLRSRYRSHPQRQGRGALHEQGHAGICAVHRSLLRRRAVCFQLFLHSPGHVPVHQGAAFLKDTGFSGIPLIICFLVLTACINFFIGSAMAKWALLAPIFVPMLMQMQYSPYFIQAAYRIADSTTNAISPLEPFMAFVIGVAQKYAKNVGLGHHHFPDAAVRSGHSDRLGALPHHLDGTRHSARPRRARLHVILPNPFRRAFRYRQRRFALLRFSGLPFFTEHQFHAQYASGGYGAVF